MCQLLSLTLSIPETILISAKVFILHRFTNRPSDTRNDLSAGYDKDWLYFVANCRAGNDIFDFDLIIGGIANDRVIQTLDRYFDGELSEDETLGLLKYEQPNIQYCIRSQKMLDNCLKHIESRQL